MATINNAKFQREMAERWNKMEERRAERAARPIATPDFKESTTTTTDIAASMRFVRQIYRDDTMVLQQSDDGSNWSDVGPAASEIKAPPYEREGLPVTLRTGLPYAQFRGLMPSASFGSELLVKQMSEVANTLAEYAIARVMALFIYPACALCGSTGPEWLCSPPLPGPEWGQQVRFRAKAPFCCDGLPRLKPKRVLSLC